MKHIIMIATLLIAINCGGIPVDVNVDGIADALGIGSDDDESTTETDTSDSTVDSTTSYEIETSGRSTTDSRLFVGTWADADAFGTCPYWPEVIRVYTHNGMIDIEDNSQELVDSTPLFPDDTFDMEATYVNSLGSQSIEVVCTCNIDEHQYYEDELTCACEYGTTECNLAYDKME